MWYVNFGPGEFMFGNAVAVVFRLAIHLGCIRIGALRQADFRLGDVQKTVRSAGRAFARLGGVQ